MSKHLAPEELLTHKGWMTNLAHSLVMDPNEADDVLQQAFVEVIERRPARPHSLGAWLRTVLGNLAWKNRRAQARRHRREASVARPELASTSPEDVVERAELHRLVVDQVLALPEPYREAVLLRYFEDLSAVDVARRQRVPLATARTRLQRGLDRLRQELDRSHGNDRSQWLTALLPVAGLGGAGTLSSSATAAALESQAGAIIANTAASTAAQTAQTILQGLTLGGSLLTQKTAITVIVLTAASLALGGAIGRYTARMDADDAKARFGLVEETRVSDLETQLQQAQAELVTTAAALKRIETEKTDLTARIASVTDELEAERDKVAALNAPPAARKLPIAFGDFAELEGLAKADWPEAGEAVKEMNSLFLELLASLEKGEPISPEIQKKLQEENNKLVKVAAAVLGKIPTNTPINGEFSHPLVLSNLMGAVLEQLGQPLTEAQKKSIASLAGGYDESFEKMQQGYTEETAALEKVVDELALKQEHMKKIRSTLSPAQLEAAYPASLRDRMQFDVTSPGVSTVLSAQPKSYASAEVAREQFQTKLLKELGIGAELGASFKEPFDAWGEEISPLLAPRAANAGPPHLDEAILAAQAEVRLLKKLLESPLLDDKTRAAILSMRGWIVPQVSEAKSNAE